MHNANGILRLVSKEIQMGNGAVVILRLTLSRFKGIAVDGAGNGEDAAALGGLAYIHITQQIRSKVVYRNLLPSRQIHIILAIVGFINGSVAVGYRIGNGGTAVRERGAVDGGADAAGRFIGAGVSSNHKAGVFQLGCGFVNFGLGGLFRRIGTWCKACHIVSVLFRILCQQIRTGFIGVLKVLPAVHRVLILVCIGYIAGKALVISRLVLLYHLFQLRKVGALGQTRISRLQNRAHILGGLVCGQQGVIVQVCLCVQQRSGVLVPSLLGVVRGHTHLVHRFSIRLTLDALVADFDLEGNTKVDPVVSIIFVRPRVLGLCLQFGHTVHGGRCICKYICSACHCMILLIGAKLILVKIRCRRCKSFTT